MDSNSGDERPSLFLLKSVRCLECGAVYAKPSEGGTVRENPGCPDCGYVGWVAAALGPFSAAWMPPRFGADRLMHPHG